MYKFTAFMIMIGCLSVSHGSALHDFARNGNSFSSAIQIPEETVWTSSTKNTLGSGLWNGKGFSFSLTGSLWLSAANSNPSGIALPVSGKVRLDGITVSTRTSGQGAVNNCYAYLCVINNGTMTVQNRSNAFDIPGANNSTFSFDFSSPAYIATNSLYAILYSQNSEFTAGQSISMNDAVSVGMKRTATDNLPGSIGQLFNTFSTSPDENFSPYVTIRTTIPEPATTALVAFGIAGFVLIRRRA